MQAKKNDNKNNNNNSDDINNHDSKKNKSKRRMVTMIIILLKRTIENKIMTIIRDQISIDIDAILEFLTPTYLPPPSLPPSFSQ